MVCCTAWSEKEWGGVPGGSAGASGGGGGATGSAGGGAGAGGAAQCNLFSCGFDRQVFGWSVSRDIDK